MKSIKRTLLKAIFFAGYLSFLFSACTSGEQEIPGSGKLQPLEIKAEIAPQTRGAGTEPGVTGDNYEKHSFVANDRITVTNNNNATSTAAYYYNGTGWLPVATGITTIGDETFTASYPTSFAGIRADQTSYEKFWQSNQLVSSKAAIGNLVEFRFAPMAAKITVRVEYSDANTVGESVKVKGATILTESGPASEEITLLGLVTTNTRHTYEGIIYPGTKAYTITVKTTNYAAKSYEQVSKELKPGYNYIYNFSSTNNLILNSVSVEPFSDQPEISGGDAT